MMDKLDFYSDMGCLEFFIYDYRRGKFNAFRRNGGDCLQRKEAEPDGTWLSKTLGMTFGLDAEKRLWVRRPDGKLMETQRQLARRAEQESKRAEQESKRAEQESKRAEQESKRAEQESKRAEQESKRAEQEAEKAARLAAKLREMGINPDSV
jgi:hypothetical protein